MAAMQGLALKHDNGDIRKLIERTVAIDFVC